MMTCHHDDVSLCLIVTRHHDDVSHGDTIKAHDDSAKMSQDLCFLYVFRKL